MRVFLVCADPGIPPDGTKGASVHFRSLAWALARAGHDVIAFAARSPAGPIPFPVPLRHPVSVDGLLGEAATGPPDLVYERYSLRGGDGLRAARLLGSPFVLEVNAPLVLEATRHRPDTVRPGDGEAEDRLFRQADLVFAVSEPLRRFVEERRGTDEGTVLLPNGCDPILFPAAAPLFGNTVVFLGDPKPWHGAEVLPALLAALVRRDHDARLLLIGGGNGASRVVEAAREQGLGGRVRVTGPLDPRHAARRLLRGTVAVAPYPEDAFFYFCPLKVIECMAAGVPVVTTAQGDLPAIVGDGGVLVEPGDSDAFVEAVASLLADPGYRRRLGRLARERALTRFTWDGVAASLVDRVASLPADPSAGSRRGAVA